MWCQLGKPLGTYGPIYPLSYNCANFPQALRNTKLIAAYASFDERVRYMGYAIKHFAKVLVHTYNVFTCQFTVQYSCSHYLSQFPPYVTCLFCVYCRLATWEMLLQVAYPRMHISWWLSTTCKELILRSYHAFNRYIYNVVCTHCYWLLSRSQLIARKAHG